MEFLSERAEALGLPALPEFVPPPDPRDYPLQFRQGRTLTHFHAFYNHGAALPTLRKRRGRPTLWIAPDDATARDLADGDAVRVFNHRGAFEASVLVTTKVGPGTVWMRDGWPGLNRVTDGDACLPDDAVALFPFSVGQSLQDARVEVERIEVAPGAA